jgi:prepilin-type N-terminal cleavage/methylation domain-containing protein
VWLKIRHNVTRELLGEREGVSADGPELTANGIRQGAFTLVEMVVATAILGIAGVSICGAIGFLFNSVQYARENLRATQILAQTTEVIRLCNWDQTNPTNNFIPTSLTVPYFTDNATVTNGPFYQLSVTITNPPPLGASYSNDLRMVVVNATWSSGRVTHSRSVSTYVSQWGLQNYVW